MAYEIIWMDRASEEYEKLVKYLLGEWGREVAIRISIEIDQTIIRIQNSPEQFPVFRKTKKIHRCVFSPQTSIYFRINKNAIEILSIFDNRQNPKKRKL
ncbi:MAG TPA: type II toxin-antitoxin system RelE/ParE family toxin [Mucilaginibacter sp.]|jgi:plasmid stabilization system protein ParE